MLGEIVMCTYGALSEFRTEANCPGVVLRWVVSVPRCTGTHLFTGIAARLGHVCVLGGSRKEGD